MIRRDLLAHKWGIWLGYFLTEEEQQTAKYNDIIRHQHTLETLQDFIAFWTLSPFALPKNFFVTEKAPNINSWSTCVIDGKLKRVNAINYFKAGITPTWQDPKNANGARLIFQIDRDQENHEEIYEWLVWFFLSDNFSKCQEINGIRFISARCNFTVKFHYRVEIWVNFNEDDHEKLKVFQSQFMDVFTHQFNLKKFNPYFKNNKQTP